MPNIFTKEYDNTTAGVTEYRNFTVVVPGFCGKASPTCFDENDIYECKSQAKFVEEIGLTGQGGSRPGKAAIAPTLKDFREEGGTTAVYYKQLTEQEYYETYAGCVYTAEALAEGSEGYLKKNVLWQGETEEKLYKFTKSTGIRSASTYYAVILAGNEGNDAEPAVTIGQYGNQVAYELLGLGYTVLYKKLTNVTDLATDSYWVALKDKGAYDFRYIMNCLVSENAVANECIAKVANYVNENTTTNNGRGDCIALLDIDSTTYKSKKQNEAITDIEVAVNTISDTSNINKFSAFFAPYVEYKLDRTNDYDVAYSNNRLFPSVFHYLACAARARNVNHFAEWFAIAGFNRGLCDFEVAGVGCKFGEIAVNTLAPRYRASTTEGIKKSVNIIAYIRGTYYLYGNRTAENLGVDGTADGELKASHFLNIRELCCTLKKKIYVACRKYTFDPNSDALWINFCNEIAPTAEKMKANEGITDYKFIKDETDKKATLCSRVHIVPIEAVEDFDIGLYLEDSISGAAANVTENM